MAITVIRLATFIVSSYVTLSFFEWFMHKYFMHRRGVAFFYKRVRFLRSAHYRHAIQHHSIYYRRFDHEPDPIGRYISIDPDVIFTHTLAIPFVGALALFSPMLAVVFSAVLVAHHLIWLMSHREMHIPRNAFFHDWPVYRYLARYHWMHHRYRNVNYNIAFPLADLVLGTYRPPDSKDVEQMSKNGV
jgi:hypothetical protein